MVEAVAEHRPVGVHLVGSVPLPTASDVFLQTTKALPGRLVRIPDGEPAHRQSFVLFQQKSFSSTPEVLRQYDATFTTVPTPLPTPSDLSSLSATLADGPPLQTHYDEHGIESYKTFTSLRASGAIPAGTKFQLLEPVYEEALFRALKNLEGAIPHSDLSIQWDVAAEFAMIEGVTWPHFVPFFSPVKEGIIERCIRLADAVDPDVDCGFHLCYGDIGQRHFTEPKDMGYLVEIAAAISKGSKRDITYFHMPVPKERTDEEYFAPLRDLDLGKTQLYLGVVHFDDLEGTKKRIDSAAKTGKRFGVATECGMGRMPADRLDSILEISAAVSAPHESKE